MKMNLYRKYRPQLFSEIVGQDTMVRSLLNSIQKQTFSHAYLFTGPRGTGKTTTARIIAKSLNCLDNKSGEPCLKCKHCVSIEKNTFFDIIEIDAASNRNIDDFRELRERMMYPPAEGKFKVYIIDEVHMLTTHASNAFLKMLEEPPEYVIFILATTDPQKIIPTIISRCQRYDFKSVVLSKIAQRLEQIIKYENSKGQSYSVEPEVYSIIAGLANGGMRDAISLLEKVISYCDTDITVKHVSDFLSIAEIQHIEHMCNAIKNGNGEEILTIIDTLIYQGKDIVQFLVQLIEYLRDLIFFKHSSSDSAKQRFVFADSLESQKELFGSQQLIQMLAHFEQTLADMKRSEHPRLNLELGILSFITPAASPVPAQIETFTETPVSVSPAVKKTPDKHVSENNILVSDISNNVSTQLEPPVIEAPKQTAVSTADSSAPLIIDLQHIQRKWKEICDQVREVSLFTEPLIVCAQLKSYESGCLTLAYEKSHTFQMEQISDNRFKRNVEKVLSDMFGQPIKISVVAAEEQLKPEMNEDDIINDPLVKKVVEMFNGKIASRKTK